VVGRSIQTSGTADHGKYAKRALMLDQPGVNASAGVLFDLMDHVLRLSCGVYRKRLRLDIVPTRGRRMSNHRRRPALTGTGFFLISASVDIDHMTGRIATLTACFIRRCWHCGAGVVHCVSAG
jgi:hypothetical protein